MKRITAKITSGENTIYIHNNIDSAEIESLTKGDVSNIIDYGIYSNKGTLSFFDYESKFYNITNVKSVYGAKVECYVSNPVSDKKVATFLIDDYDYDNDTKLVSLQLKDRLLKWQNIPLPTIYIYKSTSLYDIIKKIEDLTSVESIIYTVEAEFLLKNIYVYCTYLEGETVWSAITKICQASMCRCCLDENDNAKIYSENIDVSQDILIRSRNILTIDSRSKPHDNKVANGVLDVTNRRTYRDDYPEDVVGSVVLSVNSYSGDIDFLVRKFVGEDETLNTNSKVVLLGGLETSNDTNPTYKATMSVPIKNYVHSITDITVLGTLYYQEEVQDGLTTTTKVVKHENNTLLLKITDTKWSFNKITDTATVEFLFNIFSLFDKKVVIEKIKVDISGVYFQDEEALVVYTNPSDLDSSVETINSNDLIQSRNHIIEEEDGIPKDHYQWLVDEIHQRFANGVYGCEMDCLVTDYYGENNELIINGNRKNGQVDTFAKQDVVVPYVTRNGAEQPYRTAADGSPMAFTVVGIKYLYNGHLTQKIMLQEKT